MENKLNSEIWPSTIIIALLISVITLIYLALLFQFNLPGADDYEYIKYSIDGDSPVKVSIDKYMTWNGRIAGNFFYSLFLQSLNFTTYHLITFSFYILFLASSFLNITTFKSFMNTKQLISIWLLTMLVIFYSINGMNTTFYWMGGTANYVVAITLFLVAFYIANKYFYIFTNIISSALIFIASLCSEASNVAFLTFYLLILLAYILNKNYTKIKLILLHTTSILTALMIMYFSPGNSVRSEDEETLTIFMALIKSFLLTLERCSEWLFVGPMIPTILIALYVIKDKPMPAFLKQFTNKTNSLFFIAASVLCAWAPHFTMAFAMGYPSLPNRAKFISQFFFQTLASIGIIYLIKHKKWDTQLFNQKKTALTILLIFLFSLTLSKEIFPSLFYIGKYKSYYNQQVKRIEYVANTNEKIIRFKPLEYKPLISSGMSNIYGVGLIYDKEIIIEGQDGYKNKLSIFQLFNKYQKKK